MQVGMIGLGKMGGNMTKRLLSAGHAVVAFDAFDEQAIRRAESAGAAPANSLEALTGQLSPPRAVWSMVPAGEATQNVVEKLAQLLEPGDIIIDGGNSNYQDSQRRAEQLSQAEIHFIDVGVSGGIWGLEEGYSLMVGGDRQAVEQLRPVFESLAPATDRGWGHVGPNGSGHFVKMVHNGIEYGMMQAYAEGFAILQAKSDFDLDVHQVAEVWRFGTVIRSWLLDLTARALSEDPELSKVVAWVDDSGEGRWTAQEAIDLAVPAPVISEALYARFRSRRDGNYADKILAAMRHQFGGHEVKEQA